MNKNTKICLNAMVGNEAPTISRMLNSVSPYIDYFVIQCNGKADNTKQIIEEYFKEKNIPGFTYEIDWNFPGWNRDHALQTCLKSEHGCDWILRMDADETLQVDSDFDWSILEDTTVQSYNVTAQAGIVKYFRTWFWNAKLPWFFQHDKRHETIHLPEIGENFQRKNLPFSFRHIVSQDGETWYVPRKFLRDALELEIDKVVGNTVLEDSYHLWYIGKSYSDCYGNPDELAFGKKHSVEYARRAIFYFERYFEVRHNWTVTSANDPEQVDEMGYFALLLMGKMYDFMDNFEMMKLCFMRALAFCPFRNEHFCYYIEILERRGIIDEIIPIIDFCLQPERKNPFPQFSAFLIEDKAYYDTSTYLVDFKNRLLQNTEKKIIDSNSFKFELN
ncbi:hypothetical protein EBU94_03555 [bacterium]|nr:hypothetical protein [bacterium]